MSDERTKAQRKGDRNENEARKILARVWRRPERVNGYGNTDPWNIADVVAMDPDIHPGVLVAQVKTNRFTPKDKRKIRGRARTLLPDTIRVEVWVRVDREGWRVYELDWQTGEFVEIVHMDTCDREATVEAYREAVEFWPKERDEYEERLPPRRDET